MQQKILFLLFVLFAISTAEATSPVDINSIIMRMSFKLINFSI